MRVDNYGGNAMVASDTVYGLTRRYNFLACSITGNLKTCKAGKLNQEINMTTGHVTFSEDGTSFKLECDLEN